MPEDRIRYDILVQEALRGVVRKVLQEVAQAGLPGNHHFFITFLTNAPGVRISSRLRERYPEQMTIVIQYQYWDLKVTEKGFEVVLSFSDIPEKLEIPFSAIRGFYDPSANFEVEFEVKPEAAAAEPKQLVPVKEEAKPAPKVKNAGEAEPAQKKEKEAEKADGKGAEVVSLDAFRKK
ncbi:SspB family protein [Chelativorans sp.]|uniref:SspB family protein n=1 Tax=Chelativorans sp. TaxID=2203393 RepID=UPI0028117AC3|nr:SspB family protein [Chelativorans sp.]